MKKIKCTVYVNTYNQCDCIKDALDGIIKQKTTFPVDIFIFDDCSSDGTSDIVHEYVNKYPDRIHALIAKENIYSKREQRQYDDTFYREMFLEHITGDYVALCEGDDYWIDDSKLQQQVEILERDRDISMVAHSSEWVDCRTMERREFRPFKYTGVIPAEEIILQPTGNLSTASLVFRKEAFIKSSDYPRCDISDITWQLNALLKGKVFYIDKVMSVYRYMHGSSWSLSVERNAVALIKHNLWMTSFYLEYDEMTKYRFHDSVQKRAYDYFFSIIESNLDLTKEEFERICCEIEDEASELHMNYLKIQKAMFSFFKGARDDTKFFCNTDFGSYKYVVIMGQGKFSKPVEKWFRYNKIQFCGFIVSDGQKVGVDDNGENVWHISEYPYDRERTLVIVAIHPRMRTEIERNLSKGGLNHYESPYWIFMEICKG